jgi:hypothetical protein
MSYKAEKNNLVKTDYCPKDIKEAIEYFINQFWLKKHSTEEKLVLYHYTTTEGMKGIIDTRSLWNSDVNYLNDPLELKYGRGIIFNILDSYSKKENDEGIKRLLNRLKDITGIQNLYNTYITCFSKYNNLLSQWERYAAKGYGYNLGFHFSSDSFSRSKTWYNIEELSEHDFLPCLRKVTYQIDEQYEIVEKFINTIIDGSKRYLNGGNYIDKAWDAIASIKAADILLELMYSFKSPSFSEEYEWRLVYMIDKKYKPLIRNHRVNNNIIKPYLDMFIYEGKNGIYNFPLHSIKFGPMLPKETTEKSLKDFLQHNNLTSLHPIKVNDEIKIDSCYGK